MILITVNGDTMSVSVRHLSELLSHIQLLRKEGIAVAVNETVIPRSEWNNYILQNGDKVIIITATQGG